MKLKTLTVFLMSFLIIAGCSSKSAEQHGSGISVEIADSQNIKHLTLIKSVGGKEVFSENIINADNSAFEKGDIVWFDVTPSSQNGEAKLELNYSENVNATESKTTYKINISNAKQWVNVKFEDGQLKLLDYE